MLCSVVGKWSVSCHPDYPSNLIHVLEEGNHIHMGTMGGTNMAPCFTVFCCPVSTIRRNCKEKCETSCESVLSSESFCRCREYNGDSHYFPLAINCR